MGTTIGAIKGDTRGLDYGSYGKIGDRRTLGLYRDKWFKV